MADSAVGDNMAAFGTPDTRGSVFWSIDGIA